jgi:hypothetical protein
MVVSPLSSNPSKTVFVLQADNPTSDFIGQFSPSILKEWAESILESFGDEDAVYLYSHSSGNEETTARYLSASMEHGGELQVCCAGVDNDDVIKKKVKK